jgi:hypothetical protein
MNTNGPRRHWPVLLTWLSLIALSFQQVCLAETLKADPRARPGSRKYYRSLVSRLRSGDTLLLPSGIYRERLDLEGLHGKEDAWIVISGPELGAPAVITTDSPCCNTVQLGNTSYVAIKNLTIDSDSEGVGGSIDGINAKGGPTHHILIENCIIRGQSYHQQTVGISTKSTAWDWTIRGNTLIRAGTGLYLGNSNGSAPFIAGMIEKNLVVDPIGYCMEIKFQRPYLATPEMPSWPNRTVIRDNVFIKRIGQAAWPKMSDGKSRLSGARPNLLLGGFPSSGPGASDIYEIYGNFFFQNPDESLLQASGRVAIHDNIFVGNGGAAVVLQHHNLPLKLAFVFNNTIYGVARGIWLGNPALEDSAVIGNLILARSGITGSAVENSDNIIGIVDNALLYVAKPSLGLGDMDFYPLPGRCRGQAMDLSRFAAFIDYDRDFNATGKAPFVYRGAYAGDGPNPGWRLSEGLKPNRR